MKRRNRPEPTTTSWFADDYLTGADKGSQEALSRLAFNRRREARESQPMMPEDVPDENVVSIRPVVTDADRNTETSRQVEAARASFFLRDGLPFREDIEKGSRRDS